MPNTRYKMIWNNVNFIIHKLRRFNAYEMSLMMCSRKMLLLFAAKSKHIFFTLGWIRRWVWFMWRFASKIFSSYKSLYTHYFKHCRICFKVLSNIYFFHFCSHRHSTFEWKVKWWPNPKNHTVFIAIINDN